MTDIKKLSETLKKPQDPTLKALIQTVDTLSNVVKLLMLEKKMDGLNTQVAEITGLNKEDEDAPPLSEILDNLEDFCTNRKTKDGKREFLLHRLSADFEFEKAQEGNKYTTSKETSWSAEEGVADLKQDRSEATLKGSKSGRSVLDTRNLNYQN
jgi:hypothetical protein